MAHPSRSRTTDRLLFGRDLSSGCFANSAGLPTPHALFFPPVGARSSHLIPPATGDPRMSSSLVRRGAVLSALALASFIHATSLRAQAATGVVRGHVTEGSGGRGIPEVQVTIAGTRIGAVT